MMETDQGCSKEFHDSHRSALADCPLVEIVHFHDCLRGEVQVFAEGTVRLREIVARLGTFSEEATDLKSQLHSQFISLRRVFQAHSKAEDDLIWPALREKAGEGGVTQESLEYALEEDHSDEEYLFAEIEGLLSLLEKGCREDGQKATLESSRILGELESLAQRASDNMVQHLQREETEVLPLIQKCFSREEMARLVGTILGERPGDLMDTILAMMFRNLTPESRADMLKHVKHAVDGTFFDRWLNYVRVAHQSSSNGSSMMSTSENHHGGLGLGGSSNRTNSGERSERPRVGLDRAEYMACEKRRGEGCRGGAMASSSSGVVVQQQQQDKSCRMCNWVGRCPRESKLEPREFESAVRAIARDGSLAMAEKSKAVQMLRSCSWNAPLPLSPSSSSKPAQQQEGKRPRPTSKTGLTPPSFVNACRQQQPQQQQHAVIDGSATTTPASDASSSMDVIEVERGHLEESRQVEQREEEAEEETDMAPSYTPSGELGCRHYRRACKLRAECCGRLFPCRLCHDESTADHAMDRYAVKEIYCMRCGELQPAAKYCRNESCQTLGLPFSNYYCDICRLYDDDAHKDIYHCPYCNVCRLGKGLGIDFRHCMTCNACVSLGVTSEKHKCIEQALQGDCPVCHEPLFTSTTHYKVLSMCGHSMHRQCFQAYRNTAYTCPICKKSMEDMTSHFASLDLLMQAYPMPPEFASWYSSILCQDCGEESRDVPYHFCYHKCTHCGSYNTRVLQARDRNAAAVNNTSAQVASNDET